MRAPPRSIGHVFVEEHADTHVLEPRHHADAVVIAEHSVHARPKLRDDRVHAFESRSIRAERLAPVIAGEHADIVFETRHEFGDPRHRRTAHIGVKVAEMQDPETVEASRKPCRYDPVRPQLHLCRITPPALVEPHETQSGPDDRMAGIPVLNMEEIEPLTENLSLVGVFDPHPLTGMDPAQAICQMSCDHVVVRPRVHPRALASMISPS